MALGAFEDALRCLEAALKELPESERLNEDLYRTGDAALARY